MNRIYCIKIDDSESRVPKKKDKVLGPAWFDAFKVQKRAKRTAIYLMKTMEIRMMVT